MKLYAVVPFVLQAIAWPVAHAIFRISGSFTVEGYEHIKNLPGPFVFAANHVNDLDPVLTRAMLPMFSKPLFWLARYRKYYDSLPKHEQWRGWQSLLYSDWFFRSWGAYPTHPGTGDYEKSLKNIIALVHDGYSVCVFPQGGKARYHGKEVLVRGGAAFLAQYTDVPLVPVAISGTLNLGPRELFFGGRQLKIFIGAPISIPNEEGSNDPGFYKTQVRRTMDTVYKMLEV